MRTSILTRPRPIQGEGHVDLENQKGLFHNFTGTALGCKEYHTANQLQKRCRKKKYDSIHDRYIRDKTFRKAMIEVGRSEKIITEMDQFASEDHTCTAIKEEIDVNRGNWWTHSNVQTTIRCQQGINLISRKHCRHCTASRKRRTRRNMQHGHKIRPLLGSGMQTGGSPILSIHLKDGRITDSTEKAVTWWLKIYLREESQRAENLKFIS